MEANPYVKQFPELMKGKKIMYNHGFASSAASGTVQRIRLTFPNAQVVAWDLPLHPSDAMQLLREKVAEEKPDLIIGTSMGGMYTEMLTGIDRICVNPAFEIGATMKEHGFTGKQVWHSQRQDGETEFLVTKSLEKEYKLIAEQCFTATDSMPAEEKSGEQRRVWGLFGDADTTVNTFDLFCSHYTQAVHFHGGHRMDDRSFLYGIVPVIRWIDDRQESRERPVVFIGANTLCDSYGKPKSSLLKAYSLLIETYQVYVVLPAPTNRHADLSAGAEWVEQYLSTPAHDHVIYCNQRQLLMGDYYIDCRPCPDFMGTSIALGSDEFRTWEEVINYFRLLGGQ